MKRCGLSCALALVLGCGAQESAEGTSTGTAGSSGGTSSTGAGDSTSAPSSSGVATTSDTGGSTAADTSGPTDDSTTAETLVLCGLQDVKPGAPNPVVSGTGPMQIPPDIGAILVDNCGCHYADMLDAGPPIADYSSALPLKIETWEQFHSDYGVLTQQPTIASVLERVRDSPIQFTMPHRYCNIGGGERMDPTQRQILIDWLVADAPDGATWVPP